MSSPACYVRIRTLLLRTVPGLLFTCRRGGRGVRGIHRPRRHRSQGCYCHGHPCVAMCYHVHQLNCGVVLRAVAATDVKQLRDQFEGGSVRVPLPWNSSGKPGLCPCSLLLERLPNDAHHEIVPGTLHHGASGTPRGRLQPGTGVVMEM